MLCRSSAKNTLPSERGQNVQDHRQDHRRSRACCSRDRRPRAGGLGQHLAFGQRVDVVGNDDFDRHGCQQWQHGDAGKVHHAQGLAQKHAEDLRNTVQVEQDLRGRQDEVPCGSEVLHGLHQCRRPAHLALQNRQARRQVLPRRW